MTIIPLSRSDADDVRSGDRATGSTPSVETVPGRAAPDAWGTAGLAQVASREPAAPGDHADLTRRMAAGDPTALSAVVQWLWEPLAAYAYRITGDRDAAMDIAQEACLRLWERRGREPPRCIRAFLFRVTRNLALDRLKTQRTRHRLLRQNQRGWTGGGSRPDDAYERDQMARGIQRAIQDLPERRREVFALTYLQGLTYSEVSEILAISPKTVQNHMSAALAQLRVALQPMLDERRGDRSGSEEEPGVR